MWKLIIFQNTTCSWPVAASRRGQQKPQLSHSSAVVPRRVRCFRPPTQLHQAISPVYLVFRTCDYVEAGELPIIAALRASEGINVTRPYRSSPTNTGHCKTQARHRCQLLLGLHGSNLSLSLPHESQPKPTPCGTVSR